MTGQSPSQLYRELTGRYGHPVYARIDAAATRRRRRRWPGCPRRRSATELAGEEIIAKLTTAPGNGAAIGGLKVVAEAGWFAARPSGTEDVYKLYAEILRGPEHLAAIQDEAGRSSPPRSGSPGSDRVDEANSVHLAGLAPRCSPWRLQRLAADSRYGARYPPNDRQPMVVAITSSASSFALRVPNGADYEFATARSLAGEGAPIGPWPDGW